MPVGGDRRRARAVPARVAFPPAIGTHGPHHRPIASLEERARWSTTFEYSRRMDELGDPVVDPHDDVALLCQVVATATTQRITRDLAAHGFDDVRATHGYVIQGLLAGDTTSTELAQRLG